MKYNTEKNPEKKTQPHLIIEPSTTALPGRWSTTELLKGFLLAQW